MRLLQRYLVALSLVLSSFAVEATVFYEWVPGVGPDGSPGGGAGTLQFANPVLVDTIFDFGSRPIIAGVFNGIDLLDPFPGHATTISVMEFSAVGGVIAGGAYEASPDFDQTDPTFMSITTGLVSPPGDFTTLVHCEKDRIFFPGTCAGLTAFDHFGEFRFSHITPEPSSLALSLVSLLVLAAARRKAGSSFGARPTVSAGVNPNSAM